MKNKIKLFGIIAIVAIIGLSMIGCSKGGTLEIKNSAGGQILASYIIGTTVDETVIEANARVISNGQTASWSFDEDTDITWFWMLVSDEDVFKLGQATIEAGETVTIEATR